MEDNGYAIVMGMLVVAFSIFPIALWGEIKDMYKYMSDAKEQ